MREGYKFTELGEIPREWEVIKLGDHTTSFAGGTPLRSNSDYYLNGTIPWVKSGEVNQSNISFTEESITEKAVIESSARIIPPDSILVALYGATAGNVGKLKIKASSNQAVLAINSKNDHLLNDFIYCYLKLVTKHLLSLTQGSGQPNLSKGIIDKLTIPLPSSSEQQKIATILSTVDEKIEIIDVQITQTRELKKGLMQKLLTRGIGHAKFKDSVLGEIPESWEVGKLGNYTRSFAGGTPLRSKSEYFENGTIPWVKSGEVNQVTITKTEESITEKAITESSARIIESGSILVALYGATAGNVGKLVIRASSNQAVLAVKSKVKDLLDDFIYHFLKQSTPKLLSLTQGSGQPNLSKGIIDSLFIPLPPLSEQIQVISILTCIDCKIENLVLKKESYKELKKGLMQQLLTGKVRVFQPELEIA